ncbi:hypothetical protein PIB30_002495 [Stylosanthes scabra]|uniref:Uncharacterized protein n=1 Tax=Stylosanthes scabra TaxID=79078 RepID=A0ABU6X4Z2_9FABA|nr:hypothetical protein [Stylosanthes scabra]
MQQSALRQTRCGMRCRLRWQQAPARVTVPSSTAHIARRTFTLNLPRNAGVAVIPRVFYMRYRRRLGTSLLFVDQHGYSSSDSSPGTFLRYYNFWPGRINAVLSLRQGRNA